MFSENMVHSLVVAAAPGLRTPAHVCDFSQNLPPPPSSLVSRQFLPHHHHHQPVRERDKNITASPNQLIIIKNKKKNPKTSGIIARSRVCYLALSSFAAIRLGWALLARNELFALKAVVASSVSLLLSSALPFLLIHFPAFLLLLFPVAQQPYFQ